MNRILVVEDDELDKELLMDVLDQFSLQAVTCSTASRALELFDGGSFHAVMVNLTLPDMDGISLVRQLRMLSTEVLIVIITGAEDPRRRAQAIEAGATGFFAKPYTAEDNRLLLAQLSVKRAAYSRGKKMKHWRTTYGGALTATGMLLFGGPVALSTVKFKAPALMQEICIWAGLALSTIGYFLTQLAAADKRVVEDHLKTCNGGQKKD